LRGLDFSSWQGILSTLVGLAVVTLLGVGIRLLVMQSVQQRRERENRQINERLRTLIAAYKTLGGSFTGDLSVDPTHLRETRSRSAAGGEATIPAVIGPESTDRSRRIRDSVEAALSDILLLGTEDQVRLAAFAATELASGRPIHTAELVASLRAFIRQVLDLDPIAADVVIPKQGPSRPGAVKASGGGEREGKGGGGGGAGGGGGMAGAGAGLGLGLGGGMAASHEAEEENR
jgi:type II secretory pathway pseudopilin PulG